MQCSKLFPPNLDKGSNGDAVLVLQMLLNMIDPEFPVELTGRHSGRSVEAVRRLQQNRLGFKGDDVDGNFGPGTRLAMKRVFSLDVDAIPWPRAILRLYTEWVGPSHGGTARWPEEEE